MSTQRWIWQRDRVIPSDTEAGRRVVEELLEVLKRHGWHVRDVFAVHLAMEEALVNAITHGNQLDPEKRVRIESRVAADLVRVQISDEGPGFEPANLPDPTGTNRLECPGGRGVLLMKAFMSRVEWQGGGNTVILERRRGTP